MFCKQYRWNKIDFRRNIIHEMGEFCAIKVTING